MIKKVELRAYKDKLMCDKCDSEMVPEQVMYTTSPPRFNHVCPNCKSETMTYDSPYPRIVHEEI